MLFEITICLVTLTPLMVSPIIISYKRTKKLKAINYSNLKYNNELPDCLRI